MIKPPSMRQLEMSRKDIVHAAISCRAKPSTGEEIIKTAYKAAELSTEKDLASSYLWGDVVGCCEKLGIPVDDVVFRTGPFCTSLAERVLEAEDWLGSRIIAESLKDGLYANGRVIKKGNLFYIRDGEANSKGIIAYPSGALYGGDIKNGRRHGLGVYDSSMGLTHYGEWFDDQKCGQGCTKSIYPNSFKLEGRFVGDALVEPKNTAKFWCFFSKTI